MIDAKEAVRIFKKENPIFTVKSVRESKNCYYIVCNEATFIGLASVSKDGIFRWKSCTDRENIDDFNSSVVLDFNSL